MSARKSTANGMLGLPGKGSAVDHLEHAIALVDCAQAAANGGDTIRDASLDRVLYDAILAIEAALEIIEAPESTEVSS